MNLQKYVAEPWNIFIRNWEKPPMAGKLEGMRTVYQEDIAQ